MSEKNNRYKLFKSEQLACDLIIEFVLKNITFWRWFNTEYVRSLNSWYLPLFLRVSSFNSVFFLCFFKWNSFNIKHPKCVCCCCCRRSYCTVFFLSIFIMSSRLIEMYSIIFSELFVFYRKTTEYDQWIMCTQQRLFVASNGCWIQRHISLLQRYSHVTNKSWA